jgi:2-isopropylmalate synthase
MAKVQIYDTTLRDGAQREGISFSVADKLQIARKLDELGVQFIEGGWPGSNPKDVEFFHQARKLNLKNAVLTAFSSTRRAGIKAEEDANLQAALESGAQIIALVGKSSLPQVTQVLKTSAAENLAMIRDSFAYLKARGRTGFFDAEHYFDGYKNDRKYALQCLEAALEGGAECLVLCDTNGGSLPDEIKRAVNAAVELSPLPVAIHAHNDCGLAIANTLAAIEVGATQVQGTINGYGERCGNANLSVIIPDLKLKLKIDCVSDRQLKKITEVARHISEVANLVPDPFMPYVGASAFSHKGGIHVSGMSRWKESYQHIDPEKVGNLFRITISELSGKQNILMKARELALDLGGQEADIQVLLDQVKNQEALGFQYDQAEASFELLVRRKKVGYEPPFKLVDFMLVIEKRRRAPSHDSNDDMLSEAMLKVKVGSQTIHCAAEGNGPVNALDAALRKALVQFYPRVKKIQLVDYKVRILEESIGTGSQVRVLIESTDGFNEWRTVGSSANIIEASWLALADSLEYWLVKYNRQKSAQK